jgi:hypothetical protein
MPNSRSGAATALVLLLLVAGCAETGAPPPGPVGVAPEAFPPGATPPQGVLGDARVGVDDLADPAIDTIGDPFLP